MIIAAGSTNVTTYFNMRKTSDGTAADGLSITDFDMTYTRSGSAASAKVDAIPLFGAGSVHVDNKGFEVDATNQPGLYRFDWPDAAFAAGAGEVILVLKVATAHVEKLRVELSPAVNVVEVSGGVTAADNLETACDNYSATRGLAGTALPAAAADAAGGLVVSDAGGKSFDAMHTAIGTDGTNLTEAGGDGDHLVALGGMSAGMIAEVFAACWTTALVESYAAAGVAPTAAQAMYAIHQGLQMHAISGGVWTVFKLDGTTTAFTISLPDEFTAARAT